MSYRDKPWFRPVQYNDDRWEESPEQMAAEAVSGGDDEPDARKARDVEEILRRPDRREEREYECNDTTPVDYSKGPHDEEFGVEDHDFDAPDTTPLDYEQGPHDEEFGIEEDELESLDDEPDFPES